LEKKLKKNKLRFRKTLADAGHVWEQLLKTIEESEVKTAQNKIDEKLQAAKRESLREKKMEYSKTVNK
jgi:hypothetical protein